jgi:hypothetical protein
MYIYAYVLFAALKVLVPVNHGVIIDFDGLMDLLEHIFDYLRVEPKHSSLVLCQSPIDPKGSKKVSSKFGVYKFLLFSKILGHNFITPILNYTNREF